MKLIRPMEVIEAALLATNVAEDDAPVYSGATTYALGDRVIVTTGVHKVYESLANGNIGHPVTDETKWLEISATRPWRMFDQANSSKTTNTSSIAVTVQGDGLTNSVAALSVSAESIRVKVTDVIDGVVFDETDTLLTSDGVSDWYSYFFEPLTRRTDYVRTDLPSYRDAQVEVTLTADGETVECGTLVLGQVRDLGATRYQGTIGIQDYSVKATDEFGNVSITERAFSRRNTFPVWLDASLTDEIVRLLELYRATPMVWVGLDHIGSTIAYGFYKSFSMVLSYPTVTLYDIEIEGLT